MKLSRRAFLGAGLAGAAVAGAAPWLRPAGRRPIPGAILGANAAFGHTARDRLFPPPAETLEAGVVIVGGGIGGLAAARRLRRKGFDDFVLLELEDRVGGNAISGQNHVSAFPWGAAYVPITGPDSVAVTELFEELGVITGRNHEGIPVYNEEYLCADPMERLFIQGRWQEGFVPQIGLGEADQRALEGFLAEMHRLKTARGRDGRQAFSIPLDESSRDEEFLRLDRITMADYLRAGGWIDREPLRWYVDYCCRDDYGAGIDKVSAWAGLHYFASRDGRAANAPGYAVVTWPEGNGWFVNRMRADIGPRLRSSCAVWNVETSGGALVVDAYDAARGRGLRLRARGLVWAAPWFVARRAIDVLRGERAGEPQAVYSPWMVANLTLDTLPAGRGMDLAWDNVMYDSPSLGYVVATHQDPCPVPQRTVITYFLPLGVEEPAVARFRALARSHDDWCRLILGDLARVHPDIAQHVSQLDVWVWGHAMVRPVPGYIWGPARARTQQPIGNIVFAHSDQSGIAIFEEAYTRGVRAADTLLGNLA